MKDGHHISNQSINQSINLRQMREGWQPERPVRVEQPAVRMKYIKRIRRLDYYHLAQPPGSQGTEGPPRKFEFQKRH